MTLTLRVIVDDVIAPTPGGIGRYAEELTRELIRTAPVGCEVAGIVASSPAASYETLRTLLPGLSDLFKSALARRELQLAWQHGITKLPGSGMVHAMSLLAPLSRHDRSASPIEQTVVTVHDVIPWTHPQSMSPRQVSWAKAMVKRAHRYADAVVVPTHAVAQGLVDVMDFGDRIRVIGGAVSPKLEVPVDAEVRANALGLPERYILTSGSVEQRKGIEPLIASLASASDAGLPLLLAGPIGWGDLDVLAVARDAGVEEGRVRHLGVLADADLAVAVDRATVFAFPSLAEGFGFPVLEAFHFGTPVVHSNAPAVAEVAADAGISVELGEMAEYPDRLAAAISSVVDDASLAERLRYSGLDRAAAFSWRDSAQKVWQLHADL